ncbi:PqqD family protein [Leadbetterella sp. DM7]|uniref:PqqD family protein n=1 Tax=Leadbetterella sp. DM7 TaxID=3235085 RepID=UPI00349E80D3
MRAFKLNESNIAMEVFDNEAVLINISLGKYYSVRGSTGVFVLGLLQDSVHKDFIISSLLLKYSEQKEIIEREVQMFIDVLLQEEIIVETGLDSSTVATDGKTEMLPYEHLAIEVFDDMQELIMLDPIHDVDSGKGWPKRKEDI